MSGERYRIASTTLREGNIEHHVSSVVLTADEALEQLSIEGAMHLATGWDVTLIPDKTEAAFGVTVCCSRGETTRELRVRRFDPMDDHLG